MSFFRKQNFSESIASRPAMETNLNKYFSKENCSRWNWDLCKEMEF